MAHHALGKVGTHAQSVTADACMMGREGRATNAKTQTDQPPHSAAINKATRQAREDCPTKVCTHTAMPPLGLPPGPRGDGCWGSGCNALLKLQQVSAAGNTAAAASILLLLLLCRSLLDGLDLEVCTDE